MEGSLARRPHLDRCGLARIVLADQARGVTKLALDKRQFIRFVFAITITSDLAYDVGRRRITARTADNGQSRLGRVRHRKSMALSAPFRNRTESLVKAHARQDNTGCRSSRHRGPLQWSHGRQVGHVPRRDLAVPAAALIRALPPGRRRDRVGRTYQLPVTSPARYQSRQRRNDDSLGAVDPQAVHHRRRGSLRAPGCRAECPVGSTTKRCRPDARTLAGGYSRGVLRPRCHCP
jgi:hypothetical protein